MGLRLITAPADYPLSLDEVKAHLRVDHADEDALITSYLAAATNYAQKFMGRSLVTQTWELTLDAFAAEIEIPMPPLLEVLSVTYDDADGAAQVLVEGTDYAVDAESEPGWVVAVNATWPTTIDAINAVRIRFTAGYVDETASPPSENVPFDIKAAIMLTVGSLYTHRETMVVGFTAAMMPWSAEQLLRQHRVELALA